MSGCQTKTNTCQNSYTSLETKFCQNKVLVLIKHVFVVGYCLKRFSNFLFIQISYLTFQNKTMLVSLWLTIKV